MFGGCRPGPQGRLVIHSWRFLGRLISGWDIGFAESYMAGEWSSPDLTALLTLACRNNSMVESLKPLRFPRFWLRLRHALNRNTRRGSRRNIAAHYDLGNEFYGRWLDSGLTYSAGMFSSGGQTLEEAQEAKIDHVLTLLEPGIGDSVLEIGCGWGGLAERLLQKHECTVTGMTLSAEQLAYVKRRLQADISTARCDLRLQDYRDVRGTFDRVVSIEMVEAVGEAYWSTYFEKLRDRLRPGGIAVLQVITIDEDRFENYRRKPDFIQRYIFPGGMLPTKQIIERKAGEAGLQLVSKEFFGEGYCAHPRTMGSQISGCLAGDQSFGFDERFKRMWDYYLAYCQVGFDISALDVGFYKLIQSYE